MRAVTLQHQPCEWVDCGDRTDASAVAASSANSVLIDGLASSSGGGALTIVLESLTSGSVTFTLNDSADNSSFAAVSNVNVTLSSPGQAVVLGAAATLRKYAAVATSGVFSNAKFQAQVSR
jgi:hypothetical protein